MSNSKDYSDYSDNFFKNLKLRTDVEMKGENEVSSDLEKVLRIGLKLLRQETIPSSETVNFIIKTIGENCRLLLLFLCIGFSIDNDLLITHILEELKNYNCDLYERLTVFPDDSELIKLLAHCIKYPNNWRHLLNIDHIDDMFIPRPFNYSHYREIGDITTAIIYKLPTDVDFLGHLADNREIIKLNRLQSNLPAYHVDYVKMRKHLDLLIEYGFDISKSETFLNYLELILFEIESDFHKDRKNFGFISDDDIYRYLIFIQKYIDILRTKIKTSDDNKELIKKIITSYENCWVKHTPVYENITKNIYPLVGRYENKVLPVGIRKQITKDLLPTKFCEKCKSLLHYSDVHRICKFCSSHNHTSSECPDDPDKKRSLDSEDERNSRKRPLDSEDERDERYVKKRKSSDGSRKITKRRKSRSRRSKKRKSKKRSKKRSPKRSQKRR